MEGPKGFPTSGPADGTICAGGNSRFARTDFRYCITKSGYDATKPLTRASLESRPF